MSVSETVLAPVDEITESSALVPRRFHLEPRCRVCRNDLVRKKVNDLLASGASYAMIVRALTADNAELDKCDRVTVDSIRLSFSATPAAAGGSVERTALIIIATPDMSCSRIVMKP